MSCAGIQQNVEPDNSLNVVFAAPAYITHPGWEIRHGDQFSSQPCKICLRLHFHDSGLTLDAGITWDACVLVVIVYFFIITDGALIIAHKVFLWDVSTSATQKCVALVLRKALL